MDNLKNKLAWAMEVARAFIATKVGKVITALLLVAAIAAYAHHRGVVSTTDRLAMQEPVSCPAAEPIQSPPTLDEESKRRAAELASRLSDSERERGRLQRKVSDYEKQLAKPRRKGGGFALSPADARGLSNIK